VTPLGRDSGSGAGPDWGYDGVVQQWIPRAVFVYNLGFTLPQKESFLGGSSPDPGAAKGSPLKGSSFPPKPDTNRGPAFPSFRPFRPPIQ